MTPYCLRSFFRSYLGDSDFAEHLIGHATPLEKAYRKMKMEDIAAKYKTLMPNVTIFENAPDLSGINENLKAKDQQIKEITERMQRLEELINQKEHLLNLYAAQIKEKAR